MTSAEALHVFQRLFYFPWLFSRYT